MRFKVQPQPGVVQLVDSGSWCISTRGGSGGSALRLGCWRGAVSTLNAGVSVVVRLFRTHQ